MAKTKGQTGSLILGRDDLNLVALGSGWAPNTPYQYQLNTIQGNVGGGELVSDDKGNISRQLGLESFFFNVYPSETALTLTLSPIKGGNADLKTVLASARLEA